MGAGTQEKKRVAIMAKKKVYEHFFDLHYQVNSDARPFSLGVGNLWKLAVDHPESKVLPCIHRAPIENNGEPRLLLIC